MRHSNKRLSEFYSFTKCSTRFVFEGQWIRTYVFDCRREKVLNFCHLLFQREREVRLNREFSADSLTERRSVGHVVRVEPGPKEKDVNE